MGLSQRDQTKHNTLLRLGTQSVKNSQKRVGLCVKYKEVCMKCYEKLNKLYKITTDFKGRMEAI